MCSGRKNESQRLGVSAASHSLSSTLLCAHAFLPHILSRPPLSPLALLPQHPQLVIVQVKVQRERARRHRGDRVAADRLRQRAQQRRQQVDAAGEQRDLAHAAALRACA